jgi:hypothetical protein
MLRTLVTGSLLVCQAFSSFPTLQNLLEQKGLNAEKHEVITADGWRLSMVHVFKCGNCTQQEIAVTLPADSNDSIFYEQELPPLLILPPLMEKATAPEET